MSPYEIIATQGLTQEARKLLEDRLRALKQEEQAIRRALNIPPGTTQERRRMRRDGGRNGRNDV